MSSKVIVNLARPIGGLSQMGASGASGESGAVGESGASGAVGVSGASGKVGDSGQSGATGAVGSQGIPGTSGASGALGAVGSSGTSGATGANGSSGASGVGISGTSGATGAGTSGASGASGTSGATGSTGLSGTSGQPGAGGSGTVGLSGTSGTSGATGAGTSGTSGTSGATGSAGASGTSGATGGAGTSGTSGASGAVGSGGSSGTSGASVSGASGASGVSGVSGSAFPYNVANLPTGFLTTTTSTTTYTAGGSPAFTIAPTGSTFDYYIQGTKYSVGTKTLTFGSGGAPAIAEGYWIFYLDTSSNINALQITSYSQFSSIYLADCLCGAGYWDATDSIWLIAQEERHSSYLPPQSHLDDHLSTGAFWVLGYNLSNFNIVGGSPSDDTAGEFQYGSGQINDEDIVISPSSGANPSTIPVFYRNGTSAWVQQAASALPVIYDGTTNHRLKYNLNTAGTWSQSDVGQSNYVLVMLFATTDPSNPVIAIQGQNSYGTSSDARTGATTELQTLITNGLPTPEMVPLYTLIYQTSSSWTNSSKRCKIVVVDTANDNYIDWRVSRRVGGSTASQGAGTSGASGASGSAGSTGSTGSSGTSGTSGTLGTQFTWRGAYNGATAYNVNDCLSYNGSSYVCILSSTGNVPTNTTYFNVIVTPGTSGTSGTSGATGATGTSGSSGASGASGAGTSGATGQLVRLVQLEPPERQERLVLRVVLVHLVLPERLAQAELERLVHQEQAVQQE